MKSKNVKAILFSALIVLVVMMAFTGCKGEVTENNRQNVENEIADFLGDAEFSFGDDCLIAGFSDSATGSIIGGEYYTVNITLAEGKTFAEVIESLEITGFTSSLSENGCAWTRISDSAAITLEYTNGVYTLSVSKDTTEPPSSSSVSRSDVEIQIGAIIGAENFSFGENCFFTSYKNAKLDSNGYSVEVTFDSGYTLNQIGSWLSMADFNIGSGDTESEFCWVRNSDDSLVKISKTANTYTLSATKTGGSAHKIAITLDVNGGNELSVTQYYYTAYSTVTLPLPTREGCSFYGWRTSYVAQELNQTSKNNVTVTIQPSDTPVTYYAIWAPDNKEIIKTSNASGYVPKITSVHSADELKAYAKNNQGAACMLEADIDLGGEAWLPIGYIIYETGTRKGTNGTDVPYTEQRGASYTNSFFGNGHSIINFKLSMDAFANELAPLYEDATNVTYSGAPTYQAPLGFFGQLSGYVYDLDLREISIDTTGFRYIGTFAGICEMTEIQEETLKIRQSLIDNCSVTNVTFADITTTVDFDVTSGTYNMIKIIGGFIGTAPDACLTNCDAVNVVLTSFQPISFGGFVSNNTSSPSSSVGFSMENCTATSTFICRLVNGSLYYGGLAAELTGCVVKNSSASNNASINIAFNDENTCFDGSMVGGLFGCCISTEISGCASNGNINASTYQNDNIRWTLHSNVNNPGRSLYIGSILGHDLKVNNGFSGVTISGNISGCEIHASTEGYNESEEDNIPKMLYTSIVDNEVVELIIISVG